MSSKFRNGDKVIANTHKGEVVSIMRDPYGKYVYTVRFKDPGFIPSEMKYPEDYLKLDINLKPNTDDSVCPVCKTKWSVLKFNMRIWKDCKKCNKTYEAIMEDIQKKDTPPPIPGKKRYHDEDLMNEFQLMLDGLDDIGLDSPGIYGYDDDDDIF